MEESKRTSPDRWLELATSQISFRPDRRAVHAELQTHLEDKAADLQRIFPDLTEEEAAARAAAEMGDPVELGKELARLHRPWLGYLWRVSQVLLAVLVLLFFAFPLTVETSMDHPLWGGLYPEALTKPQGLSPEQATLAGYTFRILEAVYIEYSEENSHRDCVQVTFQVSSPRFWARVSPEAVQRALTLITDDTTSWPMKSFVVKPGQAGLVKPKTYFLHYSWGIFHRTFQAYLFVEEPPDRVTLAFSFPSGSFTLASDLTQEVAAG